MSSTFDAITEPFEGKNFVAVMLKSRKKLGEDNFKVNKSNFDNSFT